MSTYIGPVTNSIIDGVTKELRKKETKDKIVKNICHPIIHDITSKYYPYFLSILLMILLILILLITIIILLVCDKHK